MLTLEGALFLGATSVLIFALAVVAAYRLVVPKRDREILRGEDVHIRKEDVATPEEACRGTDTTRPMSPREVKDRLELNHDERNTKES